MDDEIEELTCMVIYSIWDLCIGEMCCCERGTDTTPSCTANLVNVKKDYIIVGHLPGKISQMCTLFSE